MSNENKTAQAVAIGIQKAQDVLDRRQKALQQRKNALAAHQRKLELKVQVADRAATLETAGFLVAAGDSWFDYPVYDVLSKLEDVYGYNVESAAHRGDPIEAMAYGHAGQLDKFARCLEKVITHGAVPKAVLLSGGGDDIAGDEFGMLLNSADSPIGGWNSEIVDGVINQRIAAAYRTMLSAIKELCKAKVNQVLPVLVHGYDYPVPDGRGFWGGWWILPGPWLEPGFREKRFTDLNTNIGLMRQIIDRFNDMLQKLVTEPDFRHVRYVDLRQMLSTNLVNDTYKGRWDNELHPSEAGFADIADKFADVLTDL